MSKYVGIYIIQRNTVVILIVHLLVVTKKNKKKYVCNLVVTNHFYTKYLPEIYTLCDPQVLELIFLNKRTRTVYRSTH